MTLLMLLCKHFQGLSVAFMFPEAHMPRSALIASGKMTEVGASLSQRSKGSVHVRVHAGLDAE